MIEKEIKNNNYLCVIIFILAACSIVYELILAQSMAAFLENTVLRYSVTIGLYMFSLGLGALWIERKNKENTVLELLKTEIALTLVGGTSVVFLYCLDDLSVPKIVFSLLAHLLVIVIGVLSGFELPLLISLAKLNKINSESQVLAFNYFGAFTGTILFAFYFFPQEGLLASAFFISSLNALVGMSLYFQYQFSGQSQEKHFVSLLYSLLFIFIVVTLGWIFSPSINEYFINQYLGV